MLNERGKRDGDPFRRIPMSPGAHKWSSHEAKPVDAEHESDGVIRALKVVVMTPEQRMPRSSRSLERHLVRVGETLSADPRWERHAFNESRFLIQWTVCSFLSCCI